MEIFIRQEVTNEYQNTEEVVKQAFLNEEYSDKKEHLLVNRIRKSKSFISYFYFEKNRYESNQIVHTCHLILKKH